MNIQTIPFIAVPMTLSGYSVQAQSPVTKQDDEAISDNRMNIVFILSDDHRYDYMGFVGKVPWLETPNMDKMAEEGAWIKNAFVTTSLSSPSLPLSSQACIPIPTR